MKQRLSLAFAQYYPFALAVPALIWQLLFFYMPLAIIVWLSFTQPSVYLFFMSWPYAHIILRSLVLGSLTGIGCFIIGYPVAYFLAFKAGRLKQLFLFLLIIPFWTNMLLHLYAWFFVLDRNGLINTLLLSWGIIDQPLQLLYNVSAVLVIMIYNYLPFMVLPLYSLLENFDRKFLEASFDLGASRWQTWTRILLPLSWPGIRSGFLLVFVPAFGEFVVPALVGGDKNMFVGSTITYYMLGNTTLTFGAAYTVVSCLALVLSMLLAYLVWRLYKRITQKEVHHGAH